MKQDEAETILKTTTTKNWQKAWWERQNSFVGHPYHQVPHYLTIRWYFVLSCTTSIALYFIFPLSGLINRTVDGESKNSTDTAVCASLKIELRQNRHQTSAVKAIQYNYITIIVPTVELFRIRRFRYVTYANVQIDTISMQIKPEFKKICILMVLIWTFAYITYWKRLIQNNSIVQLQAVTFGTDNDQ